MATRYIRGATATATALAVLSGCAAPPATPAKEVPTSPATASATATATATTAAQGIPFTLLTHCGIYEARVGDAFFVADQPLDDGNGNPPKGWGNPFQQGTITVVGRSAIFHDDLGHTVTFHERPGATSFLRICD